LARGLDDVRTRRNAGNLALSRRELGAGIEVDTDGRLEVTATSGSSVELPDFSDLVKLDDQLKTVPSDFAVVAVEALTATATPTAVRDDVEERLEEIRVNLATLTRRVNTFLERFNG